ncbi:hypothetical protein [Alsobacter sp. SYSU BS001988]
MFPNLSNFHIIDGTLTYGNYGGLNFSAGQIGGTTPVPAFPAPVDAYDALFYQHDLALQQAQTPAERILADVAVVEGVVGLLEPALTHHHHYWFV